MSTHIPVLLQEVLALLAPERGGIFVDATLGLGGHSAALLEAAQSHSAQIRIIGIDQDQEALNMAEQRLGKAIEYLWGNFSDLVYLLKDQKITEVQGILMDIGVSSLHLDQVERGFSFMQDGPLDMRMDQEGGLTAAAVVNSWPEYKLVRLFQNYGEERFSKKIAAFILERRGRQAFATTKELADLITRAYPAPLRYKHPHPATRVFQALRIEVNRELEALEKGIASALSILAPGGRLVIISFHSLEDRIVKHAFREAATTGDFELLTKKPLMAQEDEISGNSRSRSAKLRGIQRL